MTIENERTGTLTGSGVTAEGRSSPQGSGTMETGKEETRHVAATAKEAGKEAAEHVVS